MPSVLTFAPHGKLPRFPWLRRVLAFVDSRLQLPAADPDKQWPDTVPSEDEESDAETHGMNADQRYYYGLARRQLARAQAELRH